MIESLNANQVVVPDNFAPYVHPFQPYNSQTFVDYASSIVTI